MATGKTNCGAGGGVSADLIDGSIEVFEMPLSKTHIKNSLCEGDIQLERILLNNCETVGEAAFAECSKVKYIDTSSSNLRVINKNAFQSLGYNRTNPSSNRLTFDFRRSSFLSLYAGTFGTPSSAGKSIQYADFYLPKSLKTIDNGTFRYMSYVNLYFTGYAPQLLGSGVFTGYSNVKIFCYYKDLHNYKTASNWAALSSITVGYVPAGEIESGKTLPTYDQSGYLLTWYSDEALTTTITESNGQEMYCSVSNTLGASDVTVTSQDCEVVISDGTNEYDSDNPIPFDTTVTITVTPRTGYQAYILTANGETLTSGDTWTAESGKTLNVVAIFYDGEHLPIDPTFGNNSWAVIKRVASEGNLLTYWSLGDTKTIEYQGLTYHIRICDTTLNRYALTGTANGNHAVLEFVELLADSAQMNSSNINNGGWASSKMKTVTMPALYNDLPSDLKEIIEQVDVSSASDGSASGTGSLSTSSNYLFLPSAYEIFGSASYSNSIEETTQYGLYSANNTNTFRQKSKIGGTATNWWLRSPNAGRTNDFVSVYNGGSAGNYGASNSLGVAPCFCI